MQIVTKDMESMGQNLIQDRGIEVLMRAISKEEGNIITAFNNWIGLYLA